MTRFDEPCASGAPVRGLRSTVTSAGGSVAPVGASVDGVVFPMGSGAVGRVVSEGSPVAGSPGAVVAVGPDAAVVVGVPGSSSPPPDVTAKIPATTATMPTTR